MIPLVYDAARWLSRYLILPLYARVSVRGLENVPRSGPLVIVCNHLDDADPGILCAYLPRRVVFLAKAELFRVPLLRQFLRGFGAVAVHRGEADLSSLRQAHNALQRGMAVCIFPEGTSAGREARLRRAWPGAALIALRDGAPVLPIAITGSQGMRLPWVFLRPLRRARVTVTVGELFHLPPAQRLNAAAAQESTRLIMERIAALLPPSYRGYYGEQTERAAQGAEAPTG